MHPIPVLPEVIDGSALEYSHEDECRTPDARHSERALE